MSVTLTMLDARTEFFRRAGFPLDGGYDAKWVKLPVGPLTVGFPNVEARKRAVRFHDLHHVLTGYGTDWTGEAEISAWEVASGLGDHYIGWVLDLGAMSLGLFIAPKKTFRAFVRGRHSRNLYGRKFDDALLSTNVDELRRELGLSAPPETSTRDVASFAAWSALSIVFGGAAIAPLSVPLVAALYAFAG